MGRGGGEGGGCAQSAKFSIEKEGRKEEKEARELGAKLDSTTIIIVFFFFFFFPLRGGHMAMAMVMGARQVLSIIHNHKTTNFLFFSKLLINFIQLSICVSHSKWTVTTRDPCSPFQKEEKEEQGGAG